MTMEKKVLHSDGFIEPFKPRFIKEQLLRETDISEEQAEKIKIRVAEKIKKMDVDEISTSTIRAEVSAQLTSRGLFEAEEESRKLGMSVKEFEELMENGCRDNANIDYSPEMIAKYAYDSIAKEYALLKMPKDCAEAHINGFVHHHDLEYAVSRPNCFNADLRFYAKNGLKIDGKGLMGSVAKPAKTLEVLLNHMLQAWMAGATVFSGGQGYVNFNTLLAPFARGRSYEEIKQAIQGFIFNCNMSLICRGGQVLFSSIGVDLSIPDVLKDKPAIGPGGIANGVYGDYQEEADLIFRAICEVSNEKDGNGAYHRFPNLLYNIREGDLDKYSGNCKLLHETGANNPTIYYVNCTDLERTVMGCVDGNEGIWCKINNNIFYKTFYELGDMLNAQYGITPVNDMEVLTIDDNKNIIWHKVTNFIKNKDQQMYKVTLQGNKSFICDENHGMITFKGLNKKPILDCTKGSNLIDVNCKDVNVDFTVDYKSILMGFWLGDGIKNLNYGQILVSREDKKNFLKLVFEKANIEYTLTHKNRPTDEKHMNPNIYDFKFKKSDLNDMDINNFDLNDINICAGLLSGMLSSDGYIRCTGEYTNSLGAEFVSTDFNISKLFKYCCFMTGLKFSSTIKEKQGINHSDFERVYISCNESTIHTLKQLCLREKQMKIVNQFDEDMFRSIKPYKGQRVLSIELLDKRDSFCLEVNGRMIMGSDFILTSQCRTSLPMNYTGKYEKDCVNTGNFMYSTLNLPLIALETKNKNEFYNKLHEMCKIVYKTITWRRKQIHDVIYNKHMSDFLLQKDKDTGKELYNFDTTTMTIGFCGLNECLDILGEDQEEGIKIVTYLNEMKDQFKERDGLRWSVIGSPAESASHRFATIIKEKYPDAPVQGTKGHYYLTNSSHIPVSTKTTIFDHIRNAGVYHPLTLGGNILHIWLGEVWSDPEALWKLNKKIIKEGAIFWAYSKVFTYCNECGFTINDSIEECPLCKSKDLITYDRITGYYLPTRGFNDGKQQEFKDRYRHCLDN
ncbi:MAG: hypothetical protein J6B87_07455 [Clostridia bacterium]|nr:hypothetical protein [Clostridia bacterium]